MTIEAENAAQEAKMDVALKFNAIRYFVQTPGWRLCQNTTLDFGSIYFILRSIFSQYPVLLHSSGKILTSCDFQVMKVFFHCKRSEFLRKLVLLNSRLYPTLYIALSRSIGISCSEKRMVFPEATILCVAYHCASCAILHFSVCNIC